MNEIKMRDMNTEEKRMLYVETMLPDCPEGNPLIEQVLSSIEGHEERITSLVIHDGFDNNGLPRACEDAPIVFNAETGDALPLPPMGMNADEWSRYQTSSWGNVTKLDAATLSEFNLATAEGRNNSWKVDN